MSKRHKKTKLTFSSESETDDIRFEMADYDLSLGDIPKGKKTKGRQKRNSHKRAYYDD